MFNLKTLLLIAIASKACVAQLECLEPEDWEDYFKKEECDYITETCSAQENWEDHFLKGNCDKFNEAIAKLNDWNVKRGEMQTLIQRSYRGDLKMAENIYNCLSKMYEGSTFEVYEDKVKGYLALNRALTAKSQLGSYVSWKVATFMSQISSKLKTTFQSPDKELLEGYVELYSKETLPSIKSICFDEWVFINHTDADGKTLGVAISEYNNVNLWPTPASIIGDSQRKWYVTERKFRTNIYGLPVIDVIFKSVDRRRVLTSEQNGDVSSTMIGSIRNGHYHVWTVEFAESTNADKFRFKNKETCKYLRTGRYHNPQYIDYKPGPIQALSLTTDVEQASYFNVS